MVVRWFVARGHSLVRGLVPCSLGGSLVSMARWFGGSFGSVGVCLGRVGIVQVLVRFEFLLVRFGGCGFGVV